MVTGRLMNAVYSRSSLYYFHLPPPHRRLSVCLSMFLQSSRHLPLILLVQTADFSNLWWVAASNHACADSTGHVTPVYPQPDCRAVSPASVTVGD